MTYETYLVIVIFVINVRNPFISGQIQQPQQVLITAGGQIALQATNQKGSNPGQTVPVIVQTNANQNRSQTQMIVSQSSSGPLVVQQGPQGQLQLIQGSNSNQQFVISGGSNPQLMVAQPQTAMIQGQTQTVLVAQTPNQSGPGAKTIIILQPQSGTGVNQQKIVVTPQGQQLVVTQVQRSMAQASNLNNSIQNIVSGAQTIQSNSMKVVTAGTVSSNGIGKVILKSESPRPQTPVIMNQANNNAGVNNNNNNDVKNGSGSSQTSPQPSVIKDLTNPYICEWRGCTW